MGDVVDFQQERLTRFLERVDDLVNEGHSLDASLFTAMVEFGIAEHPFKPESGTAIVYAFPEAE